MERKNTFSTFEIFLFLELFYSTKCVPTGLFYFPKRVAWSFWSCGVHYTFLGPVDCAFQVPLQKSVPSGHSAWKKNVHARHPAGIRFVHKRWHTRIFIFSRPSPQHSSMAARKKVPLPPTFSIFNGRQKRYPLPHFINGRQIKVSPTLKQKSWGGV